MKTTAEAIARIREMYQRHFSFVSKLDPMGEFSGPPSWEHSLQELARLCDALTVADRALRDIQEIQEQLGGESVLLDDVREARAEMERILNENA